jgi:hypothetical protein
MAGAYRRALELLDLRARAIAEVFARLPHLRETPIRVLLRGTDEYVRARTEPVWPPMLDAESQQLARGDIPYFFRLYGRPGIHFYANEALTRVERLPLRGDVPRLDPILSVSRARGLRSPSRRKLREDGLFAVLGAFDHASIRGRYACDDLAVTYGGRTLTVRLPGGDELQTRRDLGAFVGSVYLPCRCGEVRTAFVPPAARAAGAPRNEIASAPWRAPTVARAVARRSRASAIASSRTRPRGAFSSCSTLRSKTPCSARRRSSSRASPRPSSSSV